jgi:hypothetical protein
MAICSPCVLIESEGDAGWKVYQAVKLHAETAKTFICVRIRTSDKAHRQPLIFDRMRDELWANARAWGRSGGGIPESIKLEDDLHAPEYKQNDRGLLKVTPKKDLKILLGRSPDIGDAFVLSCWEPMSTPGGNGGQRGSSAPRRRLRLRRTGSHLQPVRRRLRVMKSEIGVDGRIGA